MLETFKQIWETTLFKVKGENIYVSELVYVLLLFIGARILLYLLKSRLSKSKPGVKKSVVQKRQKAISKLAEYGLYVVFIIISLRIFDVNISPLIAGSAALLVGLGIGIQQIFKDLVSGFVMLFEGHVNEDDIIEAHGLLGVVKHIGIRTTQVVTRDGVTIIVPNSSFLDDNVINWTHESGNTRFNVAVGVAYGSDVELVNRLLKEVASKIELIASEPAPSVRLENFGDSALHFELFFWTDDVWHIENIKSELRYSIDAAFKKHNIVIPFPQHDVRIINQK